jgi:hypothetical protein
MVSLMYGAGGMPCTTGLWTRRRARLSYFSFCIRCYSIFSGAMKARWRRNNMETLFGVSEIPCDNKIRYLMDGIEPVALSGVFTDNLRTAEEAGVLKEYRVLDGGVRADPVEDRKRAQQRTEEPGIQSPTQFRTREKARV